MGFLAPALLFLGAAVSVPIILHLFQRHQGPRVVFPAVRYLRRAEKESARQIKLRQLILLMLRAAALVLIALAAARPFVRGGGGRHEPSAVVIILDNSMSSGAVVGDRRVLDHLADRALETLETAGPDDRFWLIRAGSPWEPALSGDLVALAARIRETTPTAAAANLAAALAQARSVLAAAAEGRATEIHLLTDLQATNVGNLESLSERGPAMVVWTPEAEPPPNGRVASVELEGGLVPVAGQRATLAVALAGSAEADSLAARLAVDGRIVAAAYVPPGTTALLSVPARTAGLMTGWVETDPDALRADDRRYFAVRIEAPPRVALGAPQPFLDQALNVMEEANRMRRTSVAEADVAILPGAVGLESLPVGKSAVILPPESPLELPATNRQLGAAGLPWRYASAPMVGEARFSDETLADALLEPLAATRLRRVYALERPGSATGADTVLLTLRDGAPWAIRGERAGGGRYILLASPLGSEASTVPTSVAMLPLLDRLVGAWSAQGSRRLDIAAGEEISLPEGSRLMQRPDEVREPLDGRTTWSAGGEPGLYRVLGAGDSVLTVLAVNPPAAESRLDRIDAREFRRALSSWDPVIVNAEDRWVREIFRRRLGRELWRPLLAVAIALLCAEALVAAAGRAAARRSSPAHEHAAPTMAEPTGTGRS